MLITLYHEAKHPSVPFKPLGKVRLPLPSAEHYGATTLTETQMLILRKC